MARRGRTKDVPPLLGENSPLSTWTRVCPCGGHGEIEDGRVKRWWDKNYVYDTPECGTRLAYQRAWWGETPPPHIKFLMTEGVEW